MTEISETLTFSVSCPTAPPPEGFITGTDPVLAPELVEGTELSAGVTWGTGYATSAPGASIVTPTLKQMSVNGAAAVAYASGTLDTVGDTYQLIETVTDTASNSRVFTSTMRTVTAAEDDDIAWIEATQVPSNDVTLTFDGTVHYRLAPDGSAEIRRFTAQVTGTIPAGTATRNGAMLNPRRGLAGFAASSAQGFDSRILNQNGTSAWSAALNVNPDATAVPLEPAAGDCLVVGVSNDESMPTTSSGQRGYGGVARYAVFRFTDAIQPATKLRAGVRSALIETPAGWNTATLLATRSRFRRLAVTHNISTRADRLERLRQPNNFWLPNQPTLDWQMSRASQPYGYADTWKNTYSWALYYLHTDLSDAEWLEFAIGVAQVGIDLWHSAIDGMVFQANGSWMHSRQEVVAVAGVLLSEPAMINGVAAPLSNGFANPPWLKTIHYVTQEARTDGTPVGGTWGIWVGSGGAAQTSVGRAKRIPIPQEMLGHPHWVIGTYDAAAGGLQAANSSIIYMGQNWAHMMLGVLAFGLCTLPVGADATGYYAIGHYLQRMLRLSKKIYDSAGTITATDVVHTDGHNRLSTYGDLEQTLVSLFLSETDAGNMIWPEFTHPRPEMALVPSLAVSESGVVVTFPLRAESYGFPVTRRDVRWSSDAGETWTVITGVTSPYTITGAPNSEILVGIRHCTAETDGEGAWSTNLPSNDFIFIEAGTGTGLINPTSPSTWQSRWSFDDGATWATAQIRVNQPGPLPALPGRVQWRANDADDWTEVATADIEWVGVAASSHPPTRILPRAAIVAPSSPVDPPAVTWTFYDEAGETPTDIPAMRVSLDAGVTWVTLASTSRTAEVVSGALTITPELPVGALIHFCQQQPGEPYSASNSIDHIYLWPTGVDAPLLTACPGFMLSETHHTTPIEVTA